MKLLLSYHQHLVEGLLLVVLLNFLIPYLLRKNQFKSIWWTRAGFFAFWALWAMVVFSGLIVYVFMKEPSTPPVWGMIILSFVLPILDAFRAIKLHKFWRAGESGLGFSIKIITIEALLIIGMTMWAVKAL